MKEYNCCVCHIKHAVPATMKEWTCPNGHGLTISNNTDKDKIVRLETELKQWKRWYENVSHNLRSERDKNKKLRKTIKQLTYKKK